jgi:hypothetical protein
LNQEVQIGDEIEVVFHRYDLDYGLVFAPASPEPEISGEFQFAKAELMSPSLKHRFFFNSLKQFASCENSI